MAVGPGKYDDVCTQVRETTSAQGVALIVLGGNKGGGFSVQADAMTTFMLPKLLRTMADQIEKDMG